MADRRLTIVVPAFNEAAHIATTLAIVIETAEQVLDDYELIVVDDGSRDDTADTAERFVAANTKARVKRHPSNRGVGAAYLYGLTEARFPYLTLVPGDNVFTREAIQNVFKAVDLAPLVVSYRNNMYERTFVRHTLSVICTMLMRLISRRSIRDAHSMYVYPVELARTIAVPPGYGYHIESLGRLLCLVSDYVEVPAPINPRPDANSGVMKIGVVWLLGVTIVRLAGWRIATALRQRPSSSGIGDLNAPGPRETS